MGARLSTLPEARPEQWTVAEVAEIASHVHPVIADRYKEQVERTKLDGATLIGLTPADFKSLGFERIGWPSYRTCMADLAEIVALYGGETSSESEESSEEEPPEDSDESETHIEPLGPEVGACCLRTHVVRRWRTRGRQHNLQQS